MMGVRSSASASLRTIDQGEQGPNGVFIFVGGGNRGRKDGHGPQDYDSHDVLPSFRD